MRPENHLSWCEYFLPYPQPFHLHHHPFEFGGSAARLAWLQTLHGHRDKTVAVDGTRWGAVSAVSGCSSKGWMPGIAKVILEGTYNGSSEQNGHLESSLAWQGQGQGQNGQVAADAWMRFVDSQL